MQTEKAKMNKINIQSLNRRGLRDLKILDFSNDFKERGINII